MANTVKLKNVRLSFPSLFKKSSFEGNEGKFEGTFLFPKSDKETEKIVRDAIEACKKETNNSKVPESKLCIKDGDEFEYDGYAGMWAVKAGNNKRPTVIGKDRSPLAEEDGVLYAGCYVNAIIEPWSQNNKYGKRINANLLGVQFAKDGEPFGDGPVDVTDDFDDVEDDL